MFDPEIIRRDFPILSREVYGKPLVYLDNAATAQKPLQVIDAMDKLALSSNANIHRGIHRLSIESTEAYEAARQTVARFIGASDARGVVFTSGATAAINTVAYSFSERFISEGDNIIITEAEHHSNIVPWQIVCGRKKAIIRVLPCDESGNLEYGKLPELIDKRTRLVAVTGASNVLGIKNDIKRMVDTAHGHGIPVLVDGCQSVVHGSIDVEQSGCDFFVFSGHKLYGPTGIGVLYGRPHLLEQLPPFMGGGDMVATVSFNKTTFADIPLKFEAGTANFTGAVGLAAAIDYLPRLDGRAAGMHERNLLDYATAEISSIPGVRIYGTGEDKCPILSFSVEGVHPSDIGLILDKMGIAVRTGMHCAEPLMQRYGVTGMCRASFAFYNTMEEARLLVEGVAKAINMLG
ncbi:MAG: SufS family cysteine desulfurase [Rikenellaceae bacterium]|nr:SufS family cysteine desulfurase [Rikenellaceae bacterium]